MSDEDIDRLATPRNEDPHAVDRVSWSFDCQLEVVPIDVDLT
jgi:hypothetical protein